MAQNIYSYIKNKRIIALITMNIVPRWDIYGSKFASFDVPTRDNIHRYQCNNPILSHLYMQYWQKSLSNKAKLHHTYGNLSNTCSEMLTCRFLCFSNFADSSSAASLGVSWVSWRRNSHRHWTGRTSRDPSLDSTSSASHGIDWEVPCNF